MHDRGVYSRLCVDDMFDVRGDVMTVYAIVVLAVVAFGAVSAAVVLFVRRLYRGDVKGEAGIKGVKDGEVEDEDEEELELENTARELKY